METIKTSKNVEFDVIYADGTRHHVSEGILFEAKDNKMIFHNGTDRAAVLFAAAEAAAEAIGGLDMDIDDKTTIALYVAKRILKGNADADPETNTEGGQNDAL